MLSLTLKIEISLQWLREWIYAMHNRRQIKYKIQILVVNTIPRSGGNDTSGKENLLGSLVTILDVDMTMQEKATDL